MLAGVAFLATLLPDSAIPSSLPSGRQLPPILYVKFTAAAIVDVERAGGSAGTLVTEHTGISKLDRLNAVHKAVSINRAFRPAGKFESRHRAFGLHRWYRLVFPPGTDTMSLLPGYLKLPEIEKAQGPVVIAPTVVPNDPSYSSQWHYPQIGLEQAWDTQRGSSAITVAVLDTGTNINHPDLEANIWTNPLEIAGNLIDDDNNGYVDDIHGWDFVDDDNDPTGIEDHGTHVSGTVSAVSGNGIGVAGVAGGAGAGGVRIMPTRILTPNTIDELNQFAHEAFVYAADNGARIAQNSWGCHKSDFPSGCGPWPMVEDGINYFIANSPGGHGLVVFAAGNDAVSGPEFGYPASYAPVLAVGATDRLYNRASYSNFGSWVDISAPGGDGSSPDQVYSTFISGYGYFAGTSMAAPHVTGLAALLLSEKSDLTDADLKRIMVDTRDGFGEKGQINARAAVEALHRATTQFEPNPWRIERNTATGLSDVGTVGIAAYVFLGGYSGKKVAAGPYYVYRHEMRKTVAISSVIGTPYVWGIHGAPSVGWSAANPNLQTGYCEVVSSNTTTAVVRTYVYELVNILGQQIGWAPTTPTGAKCAYGVAHADACEVFITGPTSAWLSAGNALSFSVTATGAGPFTFQWRKNGANLSDGPAAGGGTISGSNASTLTINPAYQADVGTYDVVVTNACLVSETSDPAYVCTAAPVITKQPASQYISIGIPAALTVQATASVPISYYWCRSDLKICLIDGPPRITGTNTSDLTFTPAAASDAGQYFVDVQSACGGLISNTVTLTLAPGIVQSNEYCISGTGNNVPYSWYLDVNNDANAGDANSPPFELLDLSAPGVPVNSTASDLADAFINRINSQILINGLAGYSATKSGQNCFKVTAPGSQSNNLRLFVGPDGGPSTCRVSAGGCSYNPTIVLKTNKDWTRFLRPTPKSKPQPY